MLDDIASVTLQTAIGGLGRREQVTANNIANLETPGFTASTVSFEDSLAQAVSAGDPATTRIALNPAAGAAAQDGNNVSLEQELTTATKTTLQEQLLTGALTSKYGLLATVLKG